MTFFRSLISNVELTVAALVSKCSAGGRAKCSAGGAFVNFQKRK